MLGTMHYLPPEIAQKQYYSKEIDVWSFGCFAYELATGGPPNKKIEEKAAIIDHILNKDTPPIPERWSPAYKDFIS